MIIEIVVVCILLGCIIFVKNKFVVILSVILLVGLLGYLLWNWLFPPQKEGFLNFKFRNDIENVIERPELYCGDGNTLPSDYDIMGSRNACLKKGIGIGMSMPDSYRDEYLERPPKPAPTERLYCGNSEELPAGYDGFDTRSNCLRRGVGVGLHMPDEKRIAFQDKPRRKIGKKEIMDLAKRVGIKNPADMTRNGALRAIARKLVD